MNMRTYKTDNKSFLNKIEPKQVGLNRQNSDLNSILNRLEKSYAESLIILHNFDELRSSKGIDEAYNIDFFKALNSIRTRHHIALLCVSENRHNHYLLEADGRETAHSRLDAESLHLPELTHEQIMRELKRQVLPFTESELHEFTASILNEGAPYSALKQLAAQNLSR